MTWQPPPPAGQWPPPQPQAWNFPTAATTAAQMFPHVPAVQRARRPAAMRWVAGAIVFSLLVVSAVVFNRVVLSRFFGGAASPEEAVTQAIAAIEKGDLKRLALLLPPDEVGGFGDLIDQFNRISSAIGERNPLDGREIADSVTVNVENLKLSTHGEQSGLTKVSIENADITASFDPSRMSDALKTYYDIQDLTTTHTTITVRGAEVTKDGHTEPVPVGGHAQAPFVMTVERDGSWYVSPVYTLMQYASEEKGYETSPADAAPGFGSPVKAAEGFVSALLKTTRTGDVTAVAHALGGFEGRLLLTYRNLINSSISESERRDFSIDVNNSAFSLLSIDGNTARVRPERLSMTITVDGETGQVDWDGDCLTLDEPRDAKRFCLDDAATIGPFRPLVERLNYLVAVRAGGGWKISASRTYLSWYTDMLSWIGDRELPIVKAIVRGDPTELTKVALVAATVRIGASATVHVERIGPYVDGGYAVVDIPNPSGKEFAVYCHSSGIGCEIVTLVTPSGKAESSYYGGRDEEKGDYKAVVVAPTGDVAISVGSL